MNVKFYPNRYLLFFSTVLCIEFSASKLDAQTTLYYENFNSGTSATWSLNSSAIGSNSSDDNYWVINGTYNGGFGGTTPNEPAGVTGYPQSDYMHITNELSGNASALAPADGQPVTAIMNTSINTTGYSNVTLTFYVLCRGETAKYYGTLYYSTDGGNTWTSWNSVQYSNITSWTLETVTSATNAFDNQANLRFAFTWVQGTDAKDKDPALAVDEITVVGNGSSCPVKITTNTSTNPTCNGSGNGTISLAATDTTTGSILTYYINNGTLDSNNTGTFTGLAPGTYAIKVADQYCSTTGKSDSIINPAVVTAPTATNTGPYCIGSTIQLNASTVAGATYQWTGPNGFTSGQQDASLSGTNLADSGTYSVIATIGSCSSTAGTTKVSISPAVSIPVLSSNSPICAGDSLKLTSSNVGTTYSWTGPNGFTSASENPVIANVIAADSGYYKVVASSGACSAGPDSVHVIITTIPAPSASNTGPYCTGATLQLNAGTITNATYNWTGPNNFTNQQNPSKNNIAVTDSGTYTVIATVNGCNSAPATTDVSVVPALSQPVLSSNSPVCLGDSLKLTSSSVGSAYRWVGPNGYTSSAQNPIILNAVFSDSGYYKVTVTSGSCSTNADSVQIKINPVPATPLASSNSPVCTGGTINLNASNAQGALYNWSGPNSFSDTAQNPAILNATGVNSGTYNVYTYIANCKSPLVPIVVNVGSAPTLNGVTSNSPLCSGSTLNLSGPSLAGATYSWTGPNGFSDTAQSPTLTNVSAIDGGDYIITAYLPNCTSAPDTVSVTVNQSPQPPVLTSIYDTICSGDSVQVCAPNTFSTYAWSNGTSTTSCTMATYAGGYWVTITDANSCSVISQHKDIAAYAVSSVSIVVNGDTLIAYGGRGYQWLRNDTVIPGATQSLYIVPVTGNYSVAITDTNGCTASSSQVPVTVVSVGINEVNAAFNFNVYPNPASGSFNIVYTGADDKSIQLNMYNILGQGVKQESLSFSNGKNKTVDITGLPKGVYLLQFMQQGGQLLTKKLVVQ